MPQPHEIKAALAAKRAAKAARKRSAEKVDGDVAALVDAAISAKNVPDLRAVVAGLAGAVQQLSALVKDA